jgi:hypothetical protein
MFALGLFHAAAEKQSFWSPQTDQASDVIENHSLNVINVKQYPMRDEQLSVNQV